MITLFGTVLTVGEILGMGTAFVAFVSAFVKIMAKLNSIIERNNHADAKMNEMEKDFGIRITETKVALEARLMLAEGRIAGQEIRDARIDEKFNFMQGQLARLLNIVEKDK